MLEQIYSDFTTKLLPTIQSGLAITKDYFIELFGRYIKYLIITDIVSIVKSLLLIVLAYVIFRYAKKSWIARESWADSSYAHDRIPEALGFLIALLFTVFGVCAFFSSVNNLVKAIYIPEIRVYEEISDYRHQAERMERK